MTDTLFPTSREEAVDFDRLSLRRIVNRTLPGTHDLNGSACSTADHYYGITQMRAFP